MFPVRHTVTVTTIADGSATAYTTNPVRGRVLSIQYVKPVSGNFTDGVDFTITGETTGQGLWTETNVNASAQRAPRQPTHDNAGAASLFAAGGEPAEDYYVLVDERVKIVIASGGDTKTGTFHITVG